MNKKTILVGTLEDKEIYLKNLPLFIIRNKESLIDFKNNDIEHGFFHALNRDIAKEYLGIDDESSIVLMERDEYINTHIKIFNQQNEDIELLDILNKNNIKIVNLSNQDDVAWVSKELSPYIGKNFIVAEVEENQLPTITQFKNMAKRNKDNGKYKSLGESLNALAKDYGYKEYRAIKSILEKQHSFYHQTIYKELFTNKETKCIKDDKNIKTCYCTVCLTKRKSYLHDIYELLDIAYKVHSFKDFLILVNRLAEKLYFPELLRDNRLNNLFYFKDIIAKKLKILLTPDKDDSTLQSQIFTFITDMKTIIVSEALIDIKNSITLNKFVQEKIIEYNPDAILISNHLLYKNKKGIKELEDKGIIVSVIK